MKSAPAPERIVVYQMGKVGSRTVAISLRRAYEESGRRGRVYESHGLVIRDVPQFDRRRNVPEWVRRAVNEANRSRALAGLMDRYADETWNIVTLVRDPVARCASEFFDLLDESIPYWQQRCARGELTGEMLRDRLPFYRGNDLIFDWFDTQMRPVFGIDVFAEPFPVEKGYEIRVSGRYRLLILRLEDLERIGGQAMAEFLGLESFPLTRENVAEGRLYKELYRSFLSCPFPDDYLDRMYGSPLANHFYTTDEIARFRRRWS